MPLTAIRIALLPVAVAALAAIASSSVPAQDPPPAADEIVVQGRRPQSELEEPKIIVGSRIPRRSLQLNPYIASSTSLGGLTPDSGLDAWKNSMTKRTVTCRAPGVEVSPKIACVVLRINRSISAGDLAAASASVATLLATRPLTPTEAFVGQSYLFRIAEARDDQPGRRAALATMTDSGLMGEADELAALRTLAEMARRAGDTAEAMRRFRQVQPLAPEETGVRINIAALLLETGQRAEARVVLREAIALAERRGEPVPRAWQDNSR